MYLLCKNPFDAKMLFGNARQKVLSFYKRYFPSFCKPLSRVAKARFAKFLQSQNLANILFDQIKIKFFDKKCCLTLNLKPIFVKKSSNAFYLLCTKMFFVLDVFIIQNWCILHSKMHGGFARMALLE